MNLSYWFIQQVPSSATPRVWILLIDSTFFVRVCGRFNSQKMIPMDISIAIAPIYCILAHSWAKLGGLLSVLQGVIGERPHPTSTWQYIRAGWHCAQWRHLWFHLSEWSQFIRGYCHSKKFRNPGISWLPHIFRCSSILEAYRRLLLIMIEGVLK